MPAPVIDFHTHWAPYRYREAVDATGRWFGLDGAAGELGSTGARLSLEQRLEDMDAAGVDVQVLSPWGGFYQYSNTVETANAIARACNDELAEIVGRHPNRFAGLGTVPMQDVSVAVAELRRARSIGLVGVMVNDHVLGKTYDDPDFLPFWEAAEGAGAVVFFHQTHDQRCRVEQFFLTNTVGNLVERTLTFGTLAASGVLDRFPDLKLLLAHGGGYAPWAAARMDKAVGAFVADRADWLGGNSYRPPYQSTPSLDFPASHPPSAYLRSFYYDCCTFSESMLRFMIDTIGVDRIVLGTDSPASMVLTNPVRWPRSLSSLSDAEKDAILVENATRLLDG